MHPRPTAADERDARRFFLAPGSPDAPRLAPAESQHAQRVVRLAVGERLEGLDGRGRAWPLVVRESARGRFEVERAGEPRWEPEPGSEGSPLPWIEVAVALPRGARAEEMVGRLVQLGAAALIPLHTDRSTPEARGEGPRRLERLLRIAAEACKQSGRLWNLQLEAPRSVETLATSRPGPDRVRLDPRAAGTIGAWADAAGRLSRPWRATRAAPLVLAIGPEGGFTPGEIDILDRHGMPGARLAPHVLRIETAAEAALAVIVARALDGGPP